MVKLRINTPKTFVDLSNIMGDRVMYWKKGTIKKDIDNLISIYKNSTDIECIAYSISGEYLSYENYFERCSFCKLIHEHDRQKKCLRSYVDNAMQTEKFKDVSVFFCPYGLVNWTVRIVLSGEIKFYLTAGPVLMHEVDELLIENIFQKMPSAISKKDEIISNLKKIKILNTIQVRHLSELLHRLAESFMTENIFLSNKKSKLDIINNELAEIVSMLETRLNFQDTTKKTVKLYPFEKEKQFISSVRVGDKQKAWKILNEILELTYLQKDLEIAKLNAISLIVVSAHTAIEVGADLETIFEVEFMKVTSILQSRTITQLYAIMEGGINKFIESTFSAAESGNKYITSRATKYIRENYRNFNINELAKKININTTYLSKLFKKETGISYVDYVNRVRIEASKPLLKSTETLGEVAELVGFNSPSYFSKIFKEHEGVNPSEWKKINA